MVSDRAIVLLVVSVVVFMAGATIFKLQEHSYKAATAAEALAKVEPPGLLPPYTVVDGAGVSSPLSDRFGKPILMEFFSDDCIPCARELPTMAAIGAEMARAGLAVIRVSVAKGGAEPSKIFLGKYPSVDGELLIDSDRTLAKALKVRGVPTTLVISADGHEVGRVEGEVTWDTPKIVPAVMALVTEPGPDAPEAPVAGK